MEALRPPFGSAPKLATRTSSLALIAAFAIAGCSSSASKTDDNKPTKGKPNTEATAQGTKAMTPPTCATGADMKRLDGQVVRLVGVYKKTMSAHKKGGKADKFLGFVHIELEGKATDYDPKQWDGAKAKVDLGGQRPADELTKFTDKKVAVEGKLVLDPSKLAGASDHAAEAPEPVLLDAKPVELAE